MKIGNFMLMASETMPDRGWYKGEIRTLAFQFGHVEIRPDWRNDDPNGYLVLGYSPVLEVANIDLGIGRLNQTDIDGDKTDYIDIILSGPGLAPIHCILKLNAGADGECILLWDRELKVLLG